MQRARSCRGEPESWDGPAEGRIAEAEYPTVRSHQPVATLVGRRRDADHGTLELKAPR